MGPTDGAGRGGAQGGDGKPMSRSEVEDLERQGRAGGFGDRGVGGDSEGVSRAGATED